MKLILQDGIEFEGSAPFDLKEPLVGEVVFTTGMCGYVETLTDPSYAGQIIVFTYPLIGNYGVPKRSLWESKRIWASGVIASEFCRFPSHYSSERSILDWLQDEGIPALEGVDTRAVTRHIRSKGPLLGAIANNTPAWQAPQDLVPRVSISKPERIGKGKKRVIVVDCGMKEQMMRELLAFPLEILRVPFDYDWSEEEFDGVFLSNGPGDPAACLKSVEILQRGMKKKRPIFGVCLGNQLMALASGAKTFKLPFGHRGHNQPALGDASSPGVITSQNHGYAIKEETLPADWEVSYRNVNDGSIEGIRHRSLPFFSVQFHPEAAPGPLDTRALFQQFVELL